MSTIRNKIGLHPQLAEIIRQLDAASESARQLAGQLNGDQLRQRPQPGKWSVAECLVHLNLSSQEELTVIDDVLARMNEESPPSGATYKMDLLGRFLKWTLEPPPKFWSRIKTTDTFQPQNVGPVEEVLPRFLELQEQIKSRVERADGLPLDEIKVVSPFNRRVRYNLLSCFHVMLAHERRHLWQAREIVEKCPARI